MQCNVTSYAMNEPQVAVILVLAGCSVSSAGWNSSTSE